MTEENVTKIDLSGPRNAFLSAGGESLTFSREAAAPVLQACEELLGVLRAASQKTVTLEWRSGFDGISSAGQLAVGLSDRAEGGAASLKDALIEHANTVTALRDAVAQASQGFVSAEEQNKISQKAAGYSLPDAVSAGDVKWEGDEDKQDRTPSLPTPKRKTTGAQAGGMVGWGG